MTDALKVTIRRLEGRDMEAWSQLRGALYPDLGEGPRRAEMVEMMARPERWAVFVAAYPGGLMGFAEVSIRDDPEAFDPLPVGYLESLYVAPAGRRRRLGLVLAETAEAWAVERGALSMLSDADLENLPSQALHEALGYREVDRRVVYRKTLGRTEDES